MKTLTKVYETITTVFTVVILLAVCALLIPRLFGICPYVVKTGSMEPTIMTGSLAYIDMNDKTPEVGKIMTFGLSNTNGEEILVTHRIAEINSEGISFKGDANSNPDGAVIPADRLVGSYRFSIPLVGSIMQNINIVSILVIAGVVLILNIAAMLLHNRSEHKKSLKECGEEDSL